MASTGVTFNAGSTTYIEDLETLRTFSEADATEMAGARDGHSSLNPRLDASDSRIDSVESGLTAAESGANFVATSLNSVTVEVGSKSFTLVERDRAWAVGTELRIARTAEPTTAMVGLVTAYDGEYALTVSVQSYEGSGTHSGWSLSMTAEATTRIIITNPSTINDDVTIPAGYNGHSAGPITIGDSATVTVGDGATWSIS